MTAATFKLTQEILTASLAAVQTAQVEAREETISNVKSLIQSAILGSQPAQEVVAIFNAVSNKQLPIMAEVVRASINSQELPEGKLGLWLIPVTVATQDNLPAKIDLQAGLPGLKAAAAAQKALGLTASGGWAHALPTLLSKDYVAQADLYDLISLPVKVREFVRGDRNSVGLNDIPNLPTSSGKTSLYFLPVVGFLPQGVEAAAADAEQLRHRVATWVIASLNAETSSELTLNDVLVGLNPLPFSDAVSEGLHMLMQVQLKEAANEILAKSGISASGVAAMVAPYVVKGMPEGDYVVGVSLVSRLTGGFLATITMGVDFGADEAYLIGLARQSLVDMGMQMIQSKLEMVETTCCQHCGHLQYEVPQAESFAMSPSTTMRASQSAHLQ